MVTDNPVVAAVATEVLEAMAIMVMGVAAVATELPAVMVQVAAVATAAQEVVIVNRALALAAADTVPGVKEATGAHRALAQALEVLQPEEEAAMQVPVLPWDRLALVVTAFALSNTTFMR